MPPLIWHVEPRIMTRLTCALVWIGCAIACSELPTSPAPAEAPAARPSADTVSRIEILGPADVAPGETVQFRLLAHQGDGSLEVTAAADWTINEPLQWAGMPGLVTVNPRVKWGGAVIEARYERMYNVKYLTVIPKGRFILRGTVHESGYASVPVSDARVEVISGVGAGLYAITDFSGEYTLPNVAGTTTLRVTKQNYRPLEQTVTIESHLTLALPLQVLVPPPDVSGTYVLTIAAADECPVGLGAGFLPEYVRVRQYEAVMTQKGPAVQVVLSGKNPASNVPNYFDGRIGPEGLVFGLGWDAWYMEPTFAEQFTMDGKVFVFAPSGIATAKVGGARLAGTLDGRLYLFDTVRLLAPLTAVAECYSARHQFVLSR